MLMRLCSSCNICHKGHTTKRTSSVWFSPRWKCTKCRNECLSGDQMWVSLGQRGRQVRCLWKTIMGRHQMTSWLYRTLLFPFSFLPIDCALFCLLIWSLTRTRRTDKDSRGPPVWQFRTVNTNIQGQPPQQRQLNLYLYHNHITSNPSTPIFESETGLRSRGSSRLWKFKLTPQQRLTH